MGVVELSWLCLLTLLVERCRHSSKMGQKGCECESIDDLRHTGLENFVVFVFTPVARG